ncbi:MAG: ribonuclease III, partial [Ruminiclostridium sp.]|nr:ribonuclease III [Ruminiclostridium sp.]
APKQAAKMDLLLPILTEEETTIFKRGRNASPHSYPKGATHREYQIATGLETLFGWLYLQGQTDRLNELFELIMREEG